MLSSRFGVFGFVGISVLVLIVVVTFMSVNDVTFAGPPDTATILFGDPDADSGKCKGKGGKDGNPCPERGHDESQESADKLVPRNVVISAGGTVTFLSNGVHQVMVFPEGTKPEDVPNTPGTRTGFAGCPGGSAGDRYITDGDVLADPVCGGGPDTVVSPAGTFDTPGKYLVICAFQGHFFNRDMYGWVDVK